MDYQFSKSKWLEIIDFHHVFNQNFRKIRFVHPFFSRGLVNEVRRPGSKHVRAPVERPAPAHTSVRLRVLRDSRGAATDRARAEAYRSEGARRLHQSRDRVLARGHRRCHLRVCAGGRGALLRDVAFAAGGRECEFFCGVTVEAYKKGEYIYGAEQMEETENGINYKVTKKTTIPKAPSTTTVAAAPDLEICDLNIIDFWKSTLTSFSFLGLKNGLTLST